MARPRGVSSSNGVIPRPRCGKVLRVHALSARVRDYDLGIAVPVCGLPEGHETYENCVSEEAVTRRREKRRDRS